MSGSTVPRKRAGEFNRYRWFTARFWDGMRVGTWWRLLARHRFAFSLSRFPTSSLTFLANPVNSACHLWQEFHWQRRVRQVPIGKSPLFILGHWRSGTTLLHELMVLDSRHGCPSTYDCFAPSHFLSTRKFMTRWFRFLMPEQRPMDNMEAGWDRPQEDEFAMLNLGAPSIYETVAFPRHGPVHLDSLDFSGFSEQQMLDWQQTLLWFLQRVAFREQRRLVLKSPPHLGRVETLLKMFPDAQFVHIVRDPFVVYASTIRLWKSLLQTQSLQVPDHDWLPEFVLSTFNRMYAAFHRQRSLISPGRYCEVRYEQLVEDPLGQMSSIYDELGLDGFADVVPRLERHVAQIGDYQTNRYELTEEERKAVCDRWGAFARQYGYESSHCAERDEASFGK